MSYTLFSMTTRRARKQHKCIWCGQAINIGDTFEDERSVYEGHVQHHRWHAECLDGQRKIASEWGSDEFSAYENERPASDNRTPASAADNQLREGTV